MGMLVRERTARKPRLPRHAVYFLVVTKQDAVADLGIWCSVLYIPHRRRRSEQIILGTAGKLASCDRTLLYKVCQDSGRRRTGRG